MSDDLKKPDPFSLSFWMEGAENTKLGKAAHAWFSKLGKAAFWGPDQQDPLTCDATALDLLAWQRGVLRRPTENERLYRLRTAYAYANAKDAGSVAGWQRIFERLELLGPGELTLEERIPGQDWDIVGIYLSDERQAELQDVIENIVIEEYGRTCRRYQLVARVGTGLPMTVGVFDEDHCTFNAGERTDFDAGVGHSSGIYDNDHSFMEAVWA